MPSRNSLVWLLSLLLFAGCGQTTHSQAESEDLVHETPEECYAALQRASETKSIALLLSCFAAPERNQQVGMMAHLVEREAFFKTPKHDAALALLTKYGLEKLDIMGMMQSYTINGPGAQKALELVGEKVANQVEFVEAAKDLLYPSPAKDTEPAAAQQLLPPLVDLKVDQDFASATVQDPETQAMSPIFFKQVKGSWVMTSEQSAQKAPPRRGEKQPSDLN